MSGQKYACAALSSKLGPVKQLGNNSTIWTVNEPHTFTSMGNADQL